MKVLYLASNPKDQATLRIEQDITEIQRATANNSGEPVRFTFLPALPFEEIDDQLAIYKPDILHISAHGEHDSLWLSNQKESAVRLDADVLKAILAAHLPQLVYINACTSSEIAKQLSDEVPFSIGTTAEISNLAARKGALTFYRSLLRGQTLHDAYRSSAATVEASAQQQG
jgi:uncharacterized protein (DUF4415 family)